MVDSVSKRSTISRVYVASSMRSASDFWLPKSRNLQQNQKLKPHASAAFVVVHVLYRTEKERKVSLRL